MTTQVSWRADEELVERAKRRARELNTSLNGYISFVIDTATDPEAAGSEAERLRERLAAAGLLAQSPPPEGPTPTADELDDAMRAAGTGIPLSDYVSAGRGK
ncbi:MAG TPA: hypothetical protein VFN21_11415 [Acidimicrobiales bacterium]|nr:hypothetical protein [Acidimicrobiales bacterium]